MMKSIKIVVCILATFALFIIYQLSTFDMFEGISSEVILIEESNNQQIAKVYLVKRGAVGIDNPEKKLAITSKNSEESKIIMASEFIDNIRWIAKDTLQVFLTKDEFREFEHFDEYEISVIVN